MRYSYTGKRYVRGTKSFLDVYHRWFDQSACMFLALGGLANRIAKLRHHGFNFLFGYSGLFKVSGLPLAASPLASTLSQCADLPAVLTSIQQKL